MFKFIARAFGKSHVRSLSFRRASWNARPIKFEPLEERHLLAASATLVSGLLTIQGTTSSEHIEIRLETVPANTFSVYLNPSTALLTGQSRSSLQTILADMDEGNDILDVDVVSGGVGGNGFSGMTCSTFDENDASKCPTLFAGEGDDTVYGTQFGDKIKGGEFGEELIGADSLYGYDGGDLIEGKIDNDTMYGGNGNDTIYGNHSFSEGDTDENDSIYGEAGDDVIYGQNGLDWISGGTENDVIYGGAQSDTMSGDDGTDLLEGGSGDDSIYGNAGNDTIAGQVGDDRMEGGSGSDTYQFFNYDFEVVSDDDEIIEAANVDADWLDFSLFLSTNGISLNLGNSTSFQSYNGTAKLKLSTGSGIENVKGSSKNDNFDGNSRNNLIQGENGNDTIWGDTGDDTIYGGNGDDNLFGGKHQDLIYGDDGNDYCDGEQASGDTAYGGNGDDTVSGGNTEVLGDVFEHIGP